MIHGSLISAILTRSGMSAGLCSSISLVGQLDLVDDRGRGGDEVEVELALQPLLDDLQMQQAEKAAAEAEAERRRGLHLVGKARVVEPQPAHRRARAASKSAASVGKSPQNTTGCAGLKPGSGSARRTLVVGDRVADAGVGDLLDLRGDVADLAGAELGGLGHLRAEHADAVDLVMRVGAPSCGCACPFRSRRRRCAPAPRRRDRRRTSESTSSAFSGAVSSPLGGGRRWTIASSTRSMLRPVLAEIGTASEASRPITSSICCLMRSGSAAGQVDLVEHRHDLVAGVERMIDIGERLRLDPLARVDDQQRALAGGQRARHLVGEIDVAGRVHQVENVRLSVLERGTRAAPSAP